MMGKFSDEDRKFFDGLDWEREAAGLPFSGQAVPTYQLVKWVLLSHGYRLTADIVELAKLSLLRYCTRVRAHMERGPGCILSAEQKRFSPHMDGTYRTNVHFLSRSGKRP